MAQMKEQNKTPNKEPNKLDTSNLLDAEFKTLLVRMLKELTEYGNSIKKTQAEIKVTFSEVKKKSTGNHQWKGRSRDSNQQFGI